jgi:hypothetical protein
MNEQLERDVDLVLVTGAGASHAFSDDYLPLMPEWRERLEKHIRVKTPNYADLVDLRGDMSGVEFERKLGTFLQSVRAFRRTRSLVESATKLLQYQSTQIPNVVPAWYAEIDRALADVIFGINQSLFDQFGRSFLTGRAETSYQTLLTSLGIVAGESTFVYATTNYDRVGESTLHNLGFHPDLGYDYPVQGGAEFELNVRGLARVAGPNRTPVLHLHGSVGWFTRDDGTPVANPQWSALNDGGNNPGVPIVMLPDLDKDYQEFSIIDDVWTEFELILRRAKAIFVLGHSCNDLKLCDAIKSCVPSQCIGAAYHPSEENGQLQVMDRLGIGAEQTIPMIFGNALDSGPLQAIQKWLHDSSRR